MNIDWRRYVRERLSPLDIAPEREVEIVAEIALHSRQSAPAGTAGVVAEQFHLQPRPRPKQRSRHDARHGRCRVTIRPGANAPTARSSLHDILDQRTPILLPIVYGVALTD